MDLLVKLCQCCGTQGRKLSRTSQFNSILAPGVRIHFNIQIYYECFNILRHGDKKKTKKKHPLHASQYFLTLANEYGGLISMDPVYNKLTPKPSCHFVRMLLTPHAYHNKSTTCTARHNLESNTSISWGSSCPGWRVWIQLAIYTVAQCEQMAPTADHHSIPLAAEAVPCGTRRALRTFVLRKLFGQITRHRHWRLTELAVHARPASCLLRHRRLCHFVRMTSRTQSDVNGGLWNKRTEK